VSIERLKWAAIICFVIALGGLLIGGVFAKREAPPYPGRWSARRSGPVHQAGHPGRPGRLPALRADGPRQRVGPRLPARHGVLAVTLHLIGTTVRKGWRAGVRPALRPAQRRGSDLVDLRTRREMKANEYDKGADVLRLSPAQAAGVAENARFWETTFRDGDPRYGFSQHRPTAEERQQIGRFFFWTAWVASANARARTTATQQLASGPRNRQRGDPETYIWSLAGIVSLLVTLACSSSGCTGTSYGTGGQGSPAGREAD